MSTEQNNPQEVEVLQGQQVAEQVTETVELSQDESYDYESSTKGELVSEIIRLQKENPNVSKSQLNDLKSAFDIIFKEERSTAYNSYLESGGEKDGFEYQDRSVTDFFDSYKSILEAKKKNKIQQEEQRLANTRKKKQLLEELRVLVDGEESNSTFNKVKDIQKAWKETGHVAQADYHELTQSYHALLDRYYSVRSLYYDLKNLDKGKNLIAKEAIVDQAEKLIGAENSLQAIKDLNELHVQYKSLGPVPEEKSEPLWLRLKSISDKVREERNAQIEIFKAELNSNLELKKGILELLAPFEHMTLDNAKDWGTQSSNIQLIQEGWKKAGQVPLADKKAINDQFWKICRSFYANKSAFFASLDKDREANLEKKKELIAKVSELKNDSDFKETAEKIKRIQGDWKKIGQAPRAVNESIYQEFRAECDHFFDRRSAHYDEQDKAFEANAEAKSVICKKIEDLNNASQKEVFDTLVAEYHQIGFVPRNKVREAQKQFLDTTNAYIDKLTDMDSEEIQSMKLGIELGAVKGTSDERDFIESKTRTIRNKLSALNEEISTLHNNVEFFKHSKTYDSIKADVDQKVGVIQLEVDKLKEQLKILRFAKSE